MNEHAVQGRAGRAARWLHVCGCVVTLLIAAAHTLGHMQGPPKPKDEDEATLLRLLAQKELDVAGRMLTVEQINSGFSWYFTVTLVLVGVAGLTILRRGPTVVRGFAAWAGVLMILTTMLGAMCWPWPPVLMTGIAGALFLGCATSSRG